MFFAKGRIWTSYSLFFPLSKEFASLYNENRADSHSQSNVFGGENSELKV